MGTDSREKAIHFIGSRELNIKRVARDRSCSVVMNLTCFNELIEYTNCCCLSVDIIQKMVYMVEANKTQMCSVRAPPCQVKTVILEYHMSNNTQ